MWSLVCSSLGAVEILFAPFISEFVDKTKYPSTADSRTEGFRIPSLINFVDDKDEMLLRPQQAAEWYLSITCPLRTTVDTTSCPLIESKKEISSNKGCQIMIALCRANTVITKSVMVISSKSTSNSSSLQVSTCVLLC